MECKPDYVLNLFSVASEAHGYLMALYRDQNKHTAAKDIGERLKIACDEIAANPPAPSPGVTSEQAVCGKPIHVSGLRGVQPCKRLANHDGPCEFMTYQNSSRDYDFHGNPPNLPVRTELDKDDAE